MSIRVIGQNNALYYFASDVFDKGVGHFSSCLGWGIENCDENGLAKPPTPSSLILLKIGWFTMAPVKNRRGKCGHCSHDGRIDGWWNDMMSTARLIQQEM
jgi:hypothetical protein